MKTKEKILKLSQDGAVQCYIGSSDEPTEYKGVVLILHGMCEHAERYEGFAEQLTKTGYLVYAHNQRGHKGSIASKVDYGYMTDGNNFNILISDIYEIVGLIKAAHPDLPLFLFGHSMGAFLTERFAQLHGNKINGIILSGSTKYSAPTLGIGALIAKTICAFRGRRYRSKLINQLTFGAYNKGFRPNRTPYDWLNRDPIEVDKYNNDEYCGGIFTAAFYKDFFVGLLAINNNYELVPKDLPILMISGSKDPVGNYSKNVTKLYRTFLRMKIKDVELKLYDGARHEILLEYCKNEVVNDCLEWLGKHSEKLVKQI